MKQTVTVGELEIREGGDAKRSWTKYGLLDAQHKFVGSTFDKQIADVLRANRGQAVVVEIEERPGANGGKSFRDIKGAVPASQNVTANSGPDYVPPQARDQHIIRQVALKAAVELGAANVITFDDILAIADKYVAWIGEASQVEHIKATFDADEIPF